MSRKIAIEEHIARGTYRPTRHGPRPALHHPEPSLIPTDPTDCHEADIYVGHVCTLACAETGEPPKIAEKDIAAEMRYVERLGLSVSRTTVIEWLTMRREVLNPREYRAVTHGTFEQRRAGKMSAEY